jgi:nitrite reductase/ring-hydroxylating ferredoxin subunit
MMYVEVGGEPVCLINLDGKFYALGDTCTHVGAWLADGQIIGDDLECSLHGSHYDVHTGQPTGLPVVPGAWTFRVQVTGDAVQVAPSE